MTRKPRLSLAEARMFIDVDRYIRAYGNTPHNLEQTFSDTHDGGVFRREVDGLIRKRLLTVIPMKEMPGPREWDSGLMGYSWTVDLTERAMKTFWPELNERRHAEIRRQEHWGLKRERAVLRRAKEAT